MSRPVATRRTLLQTVGSGSAVLLAGCARSGSSGPPRVDVLAAGSLSVLLNESLGPAFSEETGIDYRGEFHGSRAVMRMIVDGQKRPDVVVSADVDLLRNALYPEFAEWDVVFASNSLGIVYAPETRVGSRLDAGEPWYEVLLDADASIARSDPDLDPLGYRTVQMFELAEAYYGVEGLARELVSKLVVDPAEAHLLASIETADRVAAVCYENMAADHDLPFLDLPDELNFSNPDLADHYANAIYTTDDGTVVEGTPILYNASVLSTADDPAAGRRFVGFLLAHPSILDGHGLLVRDAFPRQHGDVPREVLP